VEHSGQWVAAVAAGHQLLGTLVLGGRPLLDEADQRILERAAVVTSLMLLARRSGAEAESRVRGELVDDLLRDPDADPVVLRERAYRLGADLEQPFCVLVADIGGAERQRTVLAGNHLAQVRGGLAGSVDGRLVLLLPTEQPGKEAHQLAHDLGSALGAPVTVGAAGPVREVQAVAATYQEARRCLRALQTLGRHGDGGSADELGFVGLMLSDQPDVDGFVKDTLGPLLAYDERRRTDLVRTLETYFGCGGNLARTKDALHVHVNTVTQRLDRVAQLIGQDWQQPERMLEIQLAVRLHRLAGPTP
jgi:sugar diacid utilization regulator